MIRTNNQSSYKSINRKYLRFIGERVWKDYKKTVCEVSINFVDKDAIIELNQHYFSKSIPTDVISFNLGADPSGHEIGDIYICADVADENSVRFSCTFNEEIARLVVHGMLHFVGFEDDTPERKEHMHHLENKFLEQYSP